MTAVSTEALEGPSVRPRIVSLQVGRVVTVDRDQGSGQAVAPWRTGFFKSPVPGPIQTRGTYLEGDEQADHAAHGGPDKAILMYSAEHYPAWRDELGVEDLPYGAFGENLAVSRLTEAEVCIGDVWTMESVRLQVSQPRQPCWKLAQRWGRKELPQQVIATGRSGWYMRILTDGLLSQGAVITLESRPHPTWTVARANRALYEGLSAPEAWELANLPELARAWAKNLA